MNKRIIALNNLVTISAALLLITACTSVQTERPSSSFFAPTPKLATIYFYRQNNSPGGVVGIDIKDNGIDIGTLQNGTYFVYHANPGQHALAATADSTSTKNFKLQAGSIYYIKANVTYSQHLVHPSLSVVFDLEGQAAIQNLQDLQYHE